MTKAAISSPSVSRREESTVAQITDHSVVLNGKEEDTKENRKED